LEIVPLLISEKRGEANSPIISNHQKRRICEHSERKVPTNNLHALLRKGGEQKSSISSPDEEKKRIGPKKLENARKRRKRRGG